VSLNEESNIVVRRSQWPRGLRRRSADPRLLRLWVRIPPGAWMFVSVVCWKVEVFATSRSLVQRSPTDCGASLCVWSRNLMNEDALVQWGGGGLSPYKQTHNIVVRVIHNLGLSSEKYWHITTSNSQIAPFHKILLMDPPHPTLGEKNPFHNCTFCY